MNKKDLEGKIIGYLRKLYPTTRINSVERLTEYNTYYAVKCNVTFTNGHLNDVSTFFIDKEEVKQ